MQIPMDAETLELLRGAFSKLTSEWAIMAAYEPDPNLWEIYEVIIKGKGIVVKTCPTKEFVADSYALSGVASALLQGAETQYAEMVKAAKP